MNSSIYKELLETKDFSQLLDPDSRLSFLTLSIPDAIKIAEQLHIDSETRLANALFTVPVEAMLDLLNIALKSLPTTSQYAETNCKHWPELEDSTAALAVFLIRTLKILSERIYEVHNKSTTH